MPKPKEVKKRYYLKHYKEVPDTLFGGALNHVIYDCVITTLNKERVTHGRVAYFAGMANCCGRKVSQALSYLEEHGFLSYTSKRFKKKNGDFSRYNTITVNPLYYKDGEVSFEPQEGYKEYTSCDYVEIHTYNDFDNLRVEVIRAFLEKYNNKLTAKELIELTGYKKTCVYQGVKYLKEFFCELLEAYAVGRRNRPILDEGAYVALKTSHDIAQWFRRVKNYWNKQRAERDNSNVRRLMRRLAVCQE